MLVLVENGELYAPEPRGRAAVLLAGTTVLKVGGVDRRTLDGLGVEYQVIDAAGGPVVPGLIDPHEHLLGGSGEGGFGAQTPPIRAAEIVRGGITTVVGCLGVDTTTKTMPGLIGRVKALRDLGLSAFAWSGGYDVPPATVTGSVRDDTQLIAEVIGAGEIAVSDERAPEPSPRDLARLVTDAFVGGHLSGKAGVTHFHVGPGRRRLAPLRAVLDEFDVRPDWLYPTHVGRSEPLMDEAIDLARRGATVDVDVTQNDLPKWVRYYRGRGGPPDRLTASTDAGGSPPRSLLDQVRACVRGGLALEDVLPLVTANPARVLKLGGKGRLAAGGAADLVVLERGSLEPVDVIAGGRIVLRDGRVEIDEPNRPG